MKSKKSLPKTEHKIEKKYDAKGLAIRGKLSPEQYWKWRLTIEEMNHAKTKAELSQVYCVNKKLETEKCSLELAGLRGKFKDSGVILSESKEEYDKIREDIEADLGISLKGCMIDEYSFEVKELERE